MDKGCGLDVHKSSVFACVLKENGEKEVQEFGTLTPELDRLRDWLVKESVGHVAMESTSIYWKPIWRILSTDFHMVLVNPYYIKQLPGRKTDVKDAEWIATALVKELLKESFVPDEFQSSMRKYERMLFRLSREIVRAESLLDNELQECNIRLSNYVSDVGGKSYRAVVRELIHGEVRAEVLLNKIHKRTLNKHGADTLTAALSGFVTEANRDMMRIYFEQIQQLESQREECRKKLEELSLSHYGNQKELLETIPGISAQSAGQLLAEIGCDLKTFLTAAALVGWAGLRPRNEMSAGKIKGRRITHGNRFVRIILVQCAWAAVRTIGSRFNLKYNTLIKRMPKQKALVAIARKLLVIIWYVLKKGETYKKNEYENIHMKDRDTDKKTSNG